MKPNQYGQYKFELFHSLPPGFSPEQITRAELKKATRPWEKIRDKDIEATKALLDLEAHLHAGEGTHLFISREAAAVAHNAVRKLTIPELCRFVPDRMLGILYVEGEDPSSFECFKDADGSHVFLSFEKYGIFTSRAVEGQDYETDHDNMTPEEEGTMETRLRLIYGLLMLVREFPELLVEGPPAGLKHPAWYRRHKTKKHIQINQVTGERAPHLRHGHFRLLKSERFVNKRGELVFVRPTMVKGKAKHDEL